MAVLRSRFRVLGFAAAAFLCQGAWGVEIPHLLNGVDITGSGSAGAGSIYTMGAAATLLFGVNDDPSNNNTDTHFNYTSDISPSDPDNQYSPLKHSDNWGGGAKIQLWKTGSLGVDLDGLSDDFEQLSTNGQKITLGVDPFKVSYRFARISVASTILNANKTFSGILLYQNSFELDYDWKTTDDSTISLDGSYSIFNPPAPNLATVLNGATLVTLSSFQDTLESFEQWKFGGEWSVFWTDLIDTTASFHVSHEIIPANPLIDLTMAMGFQLDPSWHLQGGWEYSHDPDETLNIFSIEVRWSWDREVVEAAGAQAEATVQQQGSKE